MGIAVKWRVQGGLGGGAIIPALNTCLLSIFHVPSTVVGVETENEPESDEMVGWHHLLDGHEFEKAPGVGDGQGSLVCCSPLGRKESDTTV